MNKYLSILRLGWLDALEFRTEFFVSIIGWSIRLFIAVFLWLAVASARGGTIGSYSFNSILVYFFIVQTISSFIFSRVGFEMAYDIYRGDFANYMLKPLNYISFRLIYELSKNALRTAISAAIFGVVLFAAFGGISLPLWKIPLGLLAMLGAYGVNSCLIIIIALSAFWITNATRLTFIYFGILTTFSGMLFPIDLFPPKYAAIFEWLPFPYIFYFPAKIIQATALTSELMRGFIFQWGYTMILGLIVAAIYHRGVKRFEAIGR